MFGFELMFGGLGVAAVTALWNIAQGLGRFEARTSQILQDHQDWLRDHEDRLRHIEGPGDKFCPLKPVEPLEEL